MIMKFKARTLIDMDDQAKAIVHQYAEEHLDKTDGKADFDVYIVWKVKALQNWKWLLSTPLRDGMYYELTYNGDKKEFYLDAYKKFENRTVVIEEEGIEMEKCICDDCVHYSDTLHRCDYKWYSVAMHKQPDNDCEGFKERDE